MPEAPNILWICTDQQRYDTLGCYGNDIVDTPTIDGLAADGIQFNQAYCQSPICTPSRASFMTGRYPRTTGARQNGQAIPEDESLVTKALSEKQYCCGLAGKLHISPCNPSDPDRPHSERRIDDGYDQFNWSHDPGSAWPTNEYRQWVRRQGIKFHMTQRDDCEYVYDTVPAEYQQTTWCVERAMDFVRANEDSDDPWLHSLNIFDPHLAFDPAESYLQRYLDRLEGVPLPEYEDGELEDKPVFQQRDHECALHPSNREGYYPFASMSKHDHRMLRAAYFAMIDLIDDQVERLLDTLEETGQREDTLVIFMSDHGEMLGDNGIYLKGPYFYDQLTRVPLIFSWPQEIQSGVETDALVELTDIAPTLLDAAGVSHPPGIQGKSLWPRLTGEEPLNYHRDDVYCEFYDAKPGHTDPEACGTMVRTDRYKLARWHGTEGGELYDLERDPGEHDNVWDDDEYQDVKRDMLVRLSDRMADTVDPLPEREAPW